MARKIKKEIDLIEFLKRKLGYPQLKIDLLDEQFQDIIDQSIQEVTHYIYDGVLEGSLIIKLEKGKLDYILPDNIISITGIQASSTFDAFTRIPTGYVLDINPSVLATSNININSNVDVTEIVQKMSSLSMIQSLFDVKINFSFNSNKNLLRFHETPQSNTALLEIGIEYEPNPENDGIYNNKFVKKYSEGLAWIQQSTIYGKYESAVLLNGSSLAYNDMRERGLQMLEEVKEEILNNMEPLGIYVF